MRFGRALQRYWAETLLFIVAALPWLSLLVLGIVWLWQSGTMWAWAIIAGSIGLLTWPLTRFVRQRAKADICLDLGELAIPNRSWNAGEKDAWSEVLAIVDATKPFSFIELEPLVTGARHIAEAIARRLHPEAHTGWAQFTLPEILLLTERLSRDVRREALQHIPGIRALRLSHVLWARRQNERYGEVAHTGWRALFGIWRLVRAGFNPIQAIGQETSSFFLDKTASVLLYRWRAYATRMFLLEVARAAIDLYGGRLALSDEELRLAQESDAARPTEPAAPVRITLVGQINAGKSSLINAMAQAAHCAVGPVPTTSRSTEYRLELDGRPAVSLVDLPGLGADANSAFLSQAEKADIVLWVVSATQPARAPDRQSLDNFRAWARVQLARRTPPVVLALTHIDELRPASEWAPPYNIAMPTGPKARSIAAAVTSVAHLLDLPVDAIVPVALTPGREAYNIEALWTRLAVELDEGKLVQLDRLRVGAQKMNLRELVAQLTHAGRWLGSVAVKSIGRRSIS